MKLHLILFLTTTMLSLTAESQKTLTRYLDKQLQFTSKGKAVFSATGTESDGGWKLQAIYTDSFPLLNAGFKDRRFTVKNGSYTLFHNRGIKAMEGAFVNNVAAGLWRYWYPNGQLKDSGLLDNNFMVGEWKSYNQAGQLMIHANYSKTLPARALPQVSGNNTSPLLPQVSPNPGLREGPTISYYDNGQVKESGNFTNDLRSGQWTTYHPNGKTDATGIFEKDNLEGTWTFHRQSGARSTEEIYKAGVIQKMTCFDSAGNVEGNYCSILKPPVPNGPFSDFSEYVLDNVFWPEKLLNTNIEGVVKVKYIITKNGELTGFTIVESPHQLLSDEVTRFFSTLEKWSPAISHNRAIDFPMEYEIPFNR